MAELTFIDETSLDKQFVNTWVKHQQLCGASSVYVDSRLLSIPLREPLIDFFVGRSTTLYKL